MTGRAYIVVSVFLPVAVLAAGASAQAPPAPTTRAATTAPATRHAPATAPAEEGTPLQVTVKAVEGVAQRLVPGTRDQWVALKVGDQLDETTIIRTGFRTRVVLTFADRAEIVVRRATKMGIGGFRQDGQVTRARLGIKYGAIRAQVEKARGLSDFRITTPVSTLAITGTSGELAYMADFGYRLRCGDGTWTCQVGGKTRHVEPTEQTSSTMTRHVEAVKAASAPQLGDAFGGLSTAEKSSLVQSGGGRGAIGFAGAGTGAGNTIKPPKHHGPKKVIKPKKRSSHIGPPPVVRPPAPGQHD